MRRTVLAVLFAIGSTAPLAAQFGGVITMAMPNSNVTDMKYYIQGEHVAATMTMAQGAGPMSGVTIRNIIDFKGMKMVLDMSKPPQGMPEVKTDIKALGTSETVAGYKCDDFQIIENDKPTDKMCATKELGAFAFGAMQMGGRRGSSSGWTQFFNQHPGYFPLKLTGSDGKVIMEATAVQKGGVPDSIFTEPDGYMEMPNFGGRGGGF